MIWFFWHINVKLLLLIEWVFVARVLCSNCISSSVKQTKKLSQNQV